MEKLMKEQKTRNQTTKKDRPQASRPEMNSNTRRELYLEHLMGMTVGLLGSGLNKG